MVRVPQVEKETLPEEYRHLVDAMSSKNPGRAYRLMGNVPTALKPFREMQKALWFDTELTPRNRELIILTVASQAGSRYEWHRHVQVAREEGLSREDIRAIRDADLDAFTDVEGDLVRYTTAVVGDSVDQALHDAVANHFEDKTIVGVAMLASTYLALARMLSALDLTVEETFVGWDLEQW